MKNQHHKTVCKQIKHTTIFSQAGKLGADIKGNTQVDELSQRKHEKGLMQPLNKVMRTFENLC